MGHLPVAQAHGQNLLALNCYILLFMAAEAEEGLVGSVLLAMGAEQQVAQVAVLAVAPKYGFLPMKQLALKQL